MEETARTRLNKAVNGGREPDAALGALMDECERAAQGFTPRRVYRRFGLEREADGTPALTSAGLRLPGRDIRAHLEGCTGCIFIALTLGAAADRAIHLEGYRDIAKCVILDACCNIAIEIERARLEENLAAELAGEGLFATAAYSPGYGNFPLDLQPEILRLLNAGRAIGLTSGEGFLLQPRKSVTAVIGVADRRVTGRLAGCETCEVCMLFTECGYRIQGRTCADG